VTLAELIAADAAQRGLRPFFGLPGSGSPMNMMDGGWAADVLSGNNVASSGAITAHSQELGDAA
jgi:hypothetical protein